MKRLLIGLITAGLMAGCGTSATEPQPQSSLHVAAGAVLALRPITPRHLRLAGISAYVVPIQPQAGTLFPPADPVLVGWWGRRARALHGTTVIVGHTVHTGGGALNRLSSVPVGSVAYLSGVRYRVVANYPLSKKRLAARSARLFSQSGPPRLVVVTCDLADYNWTTGVYPTNTVLVARPL